MNMNSSPPPGWFPDPDHAGWQRWWDGQQWADYWIEGAQVPPEGFPDPTLGAAGNAEQLAGQGYAPLAGQPVGEQPSMGQPANQQYAQPYDPAAGAAMAQGMPGQAMPAQGMPGQGMPMAPAPVGAPGNGGGSSKGLMIGLIAAGLVLVLAIGIGVLMMGRGEGGQAIEGTPTSSTVDGEDPATTDPAGEDPTPATAEGEDPTPATAEGDDPATTDPAEEDPTPTTAEGGDAVQSEPGKGPNILAECQLQEPVSIPGTDIEVDPVTLEEEEAVGDLVREDVLTELAESPDTAAKENLNNILNRVKPADTPYNFNVTVLESDDVNAFVIPGGDIFFTTAIIDLMNDDELAFVMAHEISHELCHHLATKMQQQELIMAGAEAVGGTIDADPEAVAEIASALFAVGTLIGGYSRGDETEADLGGLELILKTDYPPEAGVTGFQKLADLQSENTEDTLPEFLSTHPDTEKRIERLQAEIDALDP